MRIMLDSTGEIVKIRGAECRVWIGECLTGDINSPEEPTHVVALIAAVGINKEDPNVGYFRNELLSLSEEQELSSSLHL